MTVHYKNNHFQLILRAEAEGIQCNYKSDNYAL